MLSDLPARSHKIRREPLRRQFNKRTGLDPRLQQMFQNIMIARKARKHSTAEGAAVFRRFIMMRHSAVFAAEFLVRPAISDFISAMQAARRLTKYLAIIHLCIFLSNIA